jgi:hypothetical protein
VVAIAEVFWLGIGVCPFAMIPRSIVDRKPWKIIKIRHCKTKSADPIFEKGISAFASI